MVGHGWQGRPAGYGGEEWWGTDGRADPLGMGKKNGGGTDGRAPAVEIARLIGRGYLC